DGFELKDNIILIAATNRPDILDPALLRPGRFDRQIVVDRPDRNGRRKILEVHAKGKPLASEIDLDALAAGTPGFTGADLANLVNEAALLAARRGKKTIQQEELEEGAMRAIAGPEKKTRLLCASERELTAREIDDEIRRVIEEAHTRAREVLEQHIDKSHQLSMILIERETIDKEQFERLLAGDAEDDVFVDEQPEPAPEPSREPERKP